MSDLITDLASELVVANHIYGKLWPRPDQHLPRADTSGLKIASQIDPRLALPALVNQLALGACTANATECLFQYDSILDGHDCGLLSRLWIYYFERALEGSLGQGDVGAIGHDAFKVAKHGIPDETLWPYDIAKFQDKPPAAFPRAYTLKKPVHAVPQSEKAIKQVLSNDQLISYGFVVYESFEEPWETPGIMPVPDPTREKVLGGHENDLVGFLSDHPGYLLARNSWDDTDDRVNLDVRGYYLVPLAVVLDQNMTSDLRTIVRSTA